MAGHGEPTDAELSEATLDGNEIENDTTEDDEITDDDTANVNGGKRPPRSPVRLAVAVSLVAIAILAGLISWLSYRGYQSHQVQQQRQQFLDVGRQAALNLTTIDFDEVDADVSRILNSATGTFLVDFQKRSQPFIDVVKQAKSKSEGTVSEAGVESMQGNQAQVLVAVQVKTSIVGDTEQQPRGWRMRIDVQKVGNDLKISNVQFVP
ncbi:MULTISPECIES: mammalian cell entry protein [unclassified Mycobacterium]|uniref:mammalian cell entry protein n=1 Tax=unclassified Mycobacterium TaxID=2642494 RepID=UPI0029C7A670|nr:MULTISPECIES: mammalian cell entry protein [unclassified Mycobacterium]